MSRAETAALGRLERAARRQWLDGAAHVHYGRCDDCGRVRDENARPLLVARQPRRRKFECLECWDGRQ